MDLETRSPVLGRLRAASCREFFETSLRESLGTPIRVVTMALCPFRHGEPFGTQPIERPTCAPSKLFQ